MNHYEKQLYRVFKTFDIDNEEALDRTAVLQLCDSLQLEDRGGALVDTLFERRSDRVTFTQFRNGLLSVLGSEPTATAPVEQVEPPPTASAPPQSDDDSSGREVAPKFVFGSKKYGRRSRPQHPTSDESPRHRVSSDSRLDGERARQRMRCKRSASAMEHRDGSFLTDAEDAADLDHDRRVDRDRAVALCRSLRMPGIDRRIVECIFNDSSVDEITVGEFFDRLNSSLTSSIAASLDGAAGKESILVDTVDIITSDVVVEAWERAGVHRPRRLLLELGFRAAALRPADLERALDDELQALGAGVDGGEEPDARILLPLAAHAVARLRSERARRRLDVAVAERDKLRTDLAEANRRARLLAQDVDENHARIEAELKTSLRQLEVRHAEAARATTAEAAAERERAVAVQAALKDDLARRTEVEVRLRAELNNIHDQYEELQKRWCALEERALATEREAARLAAERRAEGERAGGAGDAAQRAAAELAARADALRQENQLLRDRNDELCAALEAAASREARAAPDAPACWRDEQAAAGARVQEAPLSQDRTEDCNSSLLCVDPKVLGRDEAMNRLRAIFEDVRTLPRPSDESCQSCSTLQSTVALIQEKVCELSEGALLAEPLSEVAVQTDAAPGAEAATLRKELADVRLSQYEDKENLSNIIKDLESSLEQMKIEYDKCEEYWSCKLEEERAAHADELRAGDERLAELAAHVAAYERQFRPTAAAAAALPVIDERRSLELQVNDLQDEFAAYRRERDAELAAARQQLAELRERLSSAAPAAPRAPLMLHCAELEGQLRRQAQETAAGESGATAVGARCACGTLAARWRQALGAREAAALRARAARAERAAQRLHARLAAADLLVKDLYVENCRLAHLPPPPHPGHPSHLPRLP